MTTRIDSVARAAGTLIGLCALLIAGASVACFSERVTSTVMRIDPAICTGTRPSNVVIIRGFTFEPAELRVPAGTEVLWANCEPAGTDSHTSTSDTGAWDSGLLAPLDGYARMFSQTGTFPYHCEPHPGMQARIVVQ